jgi:FtsH-binding integral membrane protein
MADGVPEQRSSEFRENVVALFGLVLALLLLSACLATPIVTARLTNPWLGFLVSLASLAAWVWIGPRPMPGFGPGIICLSGLAGIIGTNLICLIWSISSLVP